MVEVSKTQRRFCAQRRSIEQIGDAIVPNAILAQTVDNSETQVYLRTTMVKRRKPVMQGWADHCDGKDADNVLAFERRA
jgi:hypothetical protein